MWGWVFFFPPCGSQGIKFRSSGLAAGILTHWILSVAHCLHLNSDIPFSWTLLTFYPIGLNFKFGESRNDSCNIYRCFTQMRAGRSFAALLCCPCLHTVWLSGVLVLQSSQTQSPTPPKPPSPSFELGLSNFPPLPGAAGNLKAEDLFENRLSSLIVGSPKERVSYASQP